MLTNIAFDIILLGGKSLKEKKLFQVALEKAIWLQCGGSASEIKMEWNGVESDTWVFGMTLVFLSSLCKSAYVFKIIDLSKEIYFSG